MKPTTFVLLFGSACGVIAECLHNHTHAAILGVVAMVASASIAHGEGVFADRTHSSHWVEAARMLVKGTMFVAAMVFIAKSITGVLFP